MYSQNYITTVNFGAFKRFTHEYQQGQSTMIYGLNKDDEGSNSNGCGKSTIFKAEAILILGFYEKDLSKDDYILDGENSALISGSFTNDVLKKTLKIKRKFYRKRSTVLEIWENGELNEQITSVREGDARILELLDLTKDDILNYYMISQGLKTSFFSSTDSQKKKVISRFSKVDSIDSSIENCNMNKKRIEGEKSLIDIEYSKLEAKIEANENSILYEKNGRAKENSKKLKKLKKTISKRSLDLDESIVKIDKAKKAVKKFKKKNDLSLISKPKEKKKLNKKLSEANKDSNEKNKKLNSVKNRISEIKRSLKTSITCPKCNHTWIEESEDSVEDLELEMEKLVSKKKKFDNSISNLSDIIENIENEIEEIELEEENSAELIESLEDLKKDLEEKEKQSVRAGELLQNAKEDKIEYEKFKVDKKRIKELQDEIEEYTEEMEDLTDEKRKLDDEYSKYAYWSVTFSRFKTFLINKVIKTLEGYVNYQLSKFKTYLTVKIEGFTDNKDGSQNEKINILVSKDDGETWQKFARYSGGQRSRINVCGIIAIQKLINLTSRVGGIDFLRLDETFDTLDTLGQIEIVNMFQNCGITTGIISHNNKDIGADNELWIEHKDKISRILNVREVKAMKESKLDSINLK